MIGWLPLIEQDLQEGRVVRLFGEDIAPTHAYFMEVAEGRIAAKATARVASWLRQQV